MRNHEASQRILERTWRIWVWIRGGLGEGPGKQGFALDLELSETGTILSLGIFLIFFF